MRQKKVSALSNPISAQEMYVDRRVRLIPIPLVLVPRGAIRPPTPFNNFAADLIKQATPEIAKELLKQTISDALNQRARAYKKRSAANPKWRGSKLKRSPKRSPARGVGNR
jgi:hypothetical protein